MCRRNGIVHVRVDGRVPQRERTLALERFSKHRSEDGSVPVLLMTLGTGALGYVEQALGRSFREGWLNNLSQAQFDCRIAYSYPRATMEPCSRRPSHRSSDPNRPREGSHHHSLFDAQLC